MSIENITIDEVRHQRNQPSVFSVSYHVNGGDYYTSEDFGIRDCLGNPTVLGRKMGIRTRDKRISCFSERGRTIEEYLYRLAIKFAGGLTKGKEPVLDRTTFANVA